MSKRDSYIDVLRGIAILLVTGFHLWRFLGKPGYTIGAWDIFAPLARGHVGVELFCILSGYTLAHVLLDKQTAAPRFPMFFKRRFLRIAPAYYSAILVWNILLELGVTHKRHGVLDNVLHLIFMHNLLPSTLFSISGVFWYIGVQMQLYLFFPLLFRFVEKRPFTAWSITLAVAVLSNGLAEFWMDGPYRSVITFGLPTYLFLFTHGIVLRARWQEVASFVKRRYIAIPLVIMALCMFFLDETLVSVGRLNSIVYGVLLGFLLTLRSPRSGAVVDGQAFKSLAFVGMCSYSIYLYNYIFMISKPVYHGIPGWLFYYTMVLVFGIWMYYLVERPVSSAVSRLLGNSAKRIL